MLIVPAKPKNPYFGKTPLRRLMKQAGAGPVSEDAIQSLITQLEKRGREITQIAIKMAEHAGRKTVTAEDIALAMEYVEQNAKK